MSLLLAAAFAVLFIDPPTDAPEQAKAVLTAQAAAWNKGDLDGFMAGYWDSDELTFYSSGTVTKGKKNISERYAKRYKAEGKEMGKLAFTDLDVQVLNADTALVRGRWKLELSKEKPDGLFTLILKKTAAGWKIMHDHTSASEVVKVVEKK